MANERPPARGTIHKIEVTKIATGDWWEKCNAQEIGRRIGMAHSAGWALIVFLKLCQWEMYGNLIL